jgi:hypothetical protein
LINKGEPIEADAYYQATAPFRMLMRGTIFHHQSLFFRSLHTILDPDQLAAHEHASRARLQPSQSRLIEAYLKLLEQNGPIQATGRAQLSALLQKELESCGNEGPYVGSYLMIQAARLVKEGRLRALINANHERFILQTREQMTKLEPNLRLAGYFPDEDD